MDWFFLTSKSEFWYKMVVINIFSIHFSSFFLCCGMQISLGIFIKYKLKMVFHVRFSSYRSTETYYTINFNRILIKITMRYWKSRTTYTVPFRAPRLRQAWLYTEICFRVSAYELPTCHVCLNSLQLMRVYEIKNKKVLSTYISLYAVSCESN